MKKDFICPLEATMDLLGGKWRTLILWHLMQEKLRFSQIQKIVSGISKKVLSEHLRFLENEGLIIRYVYPTIPPSVEYEITAKGKTLAKILESLETWGRENLIPSEANT